MSVDSLLDESITLQDIEEYAKNPDSEECLTLLKSAKKSVNKFSVATKSVTKKETVEEKDSRKLFVTMSKIDV